MPMERKLKKVNVRQKVMHSITSMNRFFFNRIRMADENPHNQRKKHHPKSKNGGYIYIIPMDSVKCRKIL
jgi:hypothetical protein